MTSFRLISVAAAALLFAQLHEAGGSGTAGAGGPAGPAGAGSGSPQKLPTSKSVDCRLKMNEEREGAELEHFKEGAQKDLLTKDENVKEICAAVIKEKDIKISVKEVGDKGTFALYYPFVEDEEVCPDAISFWKSGKLPFADPLPPTYTSDDDSPYNTYQTRSLIALFNPQPKATMDCAIVTCEYKDGAKEKAASTTHGKADSQGGDKSSSSPLKPGKPDRESWKKCNGNVGCLLSQSTGVLKSLVCVTTPAALIKDKAPYTQDQWDKVRAQISSGKMYSITAATSFVLAASALWLSAF